MARLAIEKNYFTDSYTGLVIAGFGNDELFPSLIEIAVDGVIDNMLKYVVISNTDITRGEDESVIRAFAQGEMVNRFMDGVDPIYELYIKEFARELMDNFGKEIINNYINVNSSDKRKIIQGIKNTISDYIDQFEKYSNNLKYDNFSSEVIDAVKHMPKAELAHMAEALVNITSTKRRYSAEKETVGGPIDVAVISKGDGFIWIKRKHYFDAEINRDFMHKYLRKDG